MPTGTIKYVDKGGAWGFISRDDKEPKVFVHVGAAERAGNSELRKGQRWRFDVVERADGRLEADNLEMIFDQALPQDGDVPVQSRRPIGMAPMDVSTGLAQRA